MESIPRRQAIKTIGAAGAGALIGVTQAGALSGASQAQTPQSSGTPIAVAGMRVQVAIEPVSRQTVRVTLLPVEGAGAAATTPIPLDGSLVKPSWSKPAARLTTLSAREERVRAGDLTVVVSIGSNSSGGSSGASGASGADSANATKGAAAGQATNAVNGAGSALTIRHRGR